jgi:hypothetical protein
MWRFEGKTRWRASQELMKEKSAKKTPSNVSRFCHHGLNTGI